VDLFIALRKQKSPFGKGITKLAWGMALHKVFIFFILRYNCQAGHNLLREVPPNGTLCNERSRYVDKEAGGPVPDIYNSSNKKVELVRLLLLAGPVPGWPSITL
jgi:hypothetical protein